MDFGNLRVPSIIPLQIPRDKLYTINTMPPYIAPAAAAAAKSLQSCLTLCDPIDGSPRGSSVPGILQARVLKWVEEATDTGKSWRERAGGKPNRLL